MRRNPRRGARAGRRGDGCRRRRYSRGRATRSAAPRPPSPPGAILNGRHFIRGALALVTLAALAVFAHYARALFLQLPPVWPDEPLFFQPAANLLAHGSMGTPLMDLVPGMAARTYWMPPFYFLHLVPFFALFGASLETMRAATLAAAAAVMLLAYALGRRAGLGRFGALLPVAVLAVDHAFLRGSLVGRMDMLATALVLATAWVWLAPGASAARGIGTGALAGLALMTHPTGAVAVVWVLVAECAHPHGRRARGLAAMLAGMAAAVAGWIVYILRDPASFRAQLAAQVARKAAHHFPLADRLQVHLAAYPGHHDIVVLFHVLGAAGLIAAALRQRRLWTLALLQLLLFVNVTWSIEMWYVACLVPLDALGAAMLLRAAADASAPGRRRRALAAAVAGAIVLAFVAYARWNVRGTAGFDRRMNVAARGQADYRAFCGRIAAQLPRGSRVMLACIPDPYFGLASRGDLVLHEFTPVPVDPRALAARFDSLDYVIVGRESVDAQVAAFVRAHARSVVRIAGASPDGYRADIVRVRPPAAAR